MSLPDLVQARHPSLPRERVIEPQPILALPPQPQDFVEILRKLWRHRRLIFASTVVFAAGTAFFVMQMPSHYTAEARVLVGVEEPRALNAESILTNTPPDTEQVQGEAYVVQSRGLAQKVIDQLNLAQNPEFNPSLAQDKGWLPHIDIIGALERWFGIHKKPGPALDAADAAAVKENQMIDIFLSKLDVSTLGRTHVLSIQASTENPNTSAAVANTLAKDYIDQTRSNKVEATDEVEKFLADRISELRQQVEKSEQAVEDYRKQYGLYTTGTTSSGVTAQQLSELNTQLIMAQTAKAEADARLNEAVAVKRRGLNSESVPAVLQSSLIQNLRTQQAETERQLAQLSSTYGPKHPKVQDARAAIADVREKIRLETSRIIDGLRNEAVTADARYEALRQNFDRVKSQMGNVNEKTIHLEALQRDATVNRNLLESMLSRAKEILGQEALQKSNAKLISSAAPPFSPAFPPKSLLLFLGVVGGALVGILISLMRDGADRTFRRSSQIEAVTGLPVLAMVPNLGRGPAPIAHVLRKPVSPYTEALRKLHIGLELSGSAQASPKTVLFCSSTPGEGKSVLSASLGRLLASNGRRVLLIDCDWRSPSLHRLFHCSNKDGLAALLTDEKVVLTDIIFNDALSGLDVIPAGHWRPTAIHALTSERMRLILRAFAKNYDFILLDTPPVLVGAEVLTLSRMVDKVVYAVRWGHTRQETALDGLKQIIEAQGDVAGVVLSRVDSRRYRQYGYGRLDYEYVRPALTRLG